MSWRQGLNDSIEHVVGGIVYTVLVNAIIGLKLLNPGYGILLAIFNAVLIIVVMVRMGFRGIIYLIGWLMGIGLLVYGGILNTGLIGVTEIAIDAGIPIAFIILKTVLWIQSRQNF